MQYHLLAPWISIFCQSNILRVDLPYSESGECNNLHAHTYTCTSHTRKRIHTRMQWHCKRGVSFANRCMSITGQLLPGTNILIPSHPWKIHRIADIQVSCHELIKWQGHSLVVTMMAARATGPIIGFHPSFVVFLCIWSPYFIKAEQIPAKYTCSLKCLLWFYETQSSRFVGGGFNSGRQGIGIYHLHQRLFSAKLKPTFGTCFPS